MAEIFKIDFEDGDLNDFDSTDDNFTTLDAHADAAKVGSYGMRMIEGYGYVRKNMSGEDDVYLGFHIYIDSNWTGSAYWGSIRLATLMGNTYEDYIRFGVRDNGGAGTLTYWTLRNAASSLIESNTNFSLDEWHWIELHYRVNDASTGGYELWVDGDELYSDLEVDTSAETSIVNVQFEVQSGDPLGSGDFLYWDNLITDDASRVLEPTGFSFLPLFKKQENILIRR